MSGVTVLELAWFYAAPFGTALLADLGARVIKVESAAGDPHRYQNPLPEFAGVKALGGKESIVVDYRTPEGRGILHRLVAKVRHRHAQLPSAEQRGDRRRLRQLGTANPSRFICTPRPTAPTVRTPPGPPLLRRWESPPATGATSSAGSTPSTTGARSPSKRAWSTWRPHRRSGGPTNNADAASALVVGTAMMLGLLARQRTGHGQYLETTMLCSNAYVVSDEFLDYDGVSTSPRGAATRTGRDRCTVSTRPGKGGCSSPPLGTGSGRSYRHALTTVAGAEVLGDDPRFATAETRATHGPELAAALTAVFASRPAAEWEARLVARDVACVEVSRGPFSEFTINDPTMIDNGFIADVEHPLFGRHRRHGPIVTISSTPGMAGPGCLVGQHTRPILGELGYTDAQMTDWR